jgi:dihydrofolate synthase/folylpolyglutamate synthase
MEAAEAFYAEWRRRAPGARRDLRRAGRLADALGVAAPRAPVLTVVGSKGKGTAATYASAWLAAAGARVLTVTSPGLRADAERIRLDGVSIGDRRLGELGERIHEASATLPPPRGAYLSPSGLFTLAGLLHARDAGADLLVIEAGMGGISDEAGLFPPAVVAISEIFAEHIGVLGDTPAAIATDKAAVATADTSAIVSLPQSPDVASAIAAIVATRTGGALTPEMIEPGASGVPRGLLPPGLGGPNAELGCVAARRLLDATGRRAPCADRRDAVLSSVVLPGRCSRHPVPGTRATVFVDSAIDGTGAAGALAEAYRRWDRIDHVLVCLPDHKDVPGVAAELAGLPVTYVRMADRERLSFTRAVPGGWSAADVAELTTARLAALGERLVVLGTVYFTGRVLDLVGARTDRAFTA